MSEPRPPRLPDGWTVRSDPRTWRVDGGATWIGGSPPRVLRLSAAARSRLAGPELVVADATTAALARLLSDAGVAHPDPARAPSVPGPDEVTVVVPVRDRTVELERLLAAVRATAPGLGGIVVVDDGSADPDATERVVAAHGGRVVRHPSSRGPSAARNTGARASTTGIVAFLDSDVVPEPGWLTTLLGHLGDAAVGAVAPRIVAWASPGDQENPVTRYERRRSSLDLGERPAPVTARSRVAYVPSAALLVRRSAFGEGFREDMPVAEDVDLVWRIAASGWRLRYEPAARVAHEHRASVRAWLGRKAFYGTGAAPLARHHPRRVPPVALAPWTAAAMTLLGVQRRWSVAAAGAVTVVATARLARGLRKPGEPWIGRADRGCGAADVQRQRCRIADVTTGPIPLALVLAPWGLGGAAWQAAGALTRHWWPAAVLGAVVSRRVRRALLAAAVVEGLADWLRFRDRGAGPVDAVLHVAAHRADDLAYGAGLWWGAWRHRTVEPLRPDLSGKGPDG
ncbi:mycofactocin biosynthesis glycosyltransferase MftF [Actinomycetospora endophytica]|uniref:Mycofactocin biosynthesis glycosyltransferase MftF n=1 Tax=Actinomycetospora endophytica TaxID=2291215 RepID=A0ABS8P7H7_9PSEU|nr:mycofactocin biosynthesis glycosyltransferase MftF [Actinomycetospora endophytica]MCD2194193.1 mycofactocin biosynthesis glycosyltransferase MftF [Actinomycetospora endophytica]